MTARKKLDPHQIDVKPKRGASLEERYIPVPESGCWLWLGACNDVGYGHIRRGGTFTYAHRAFYERRFGPIPADAVLLHKCDVPCCVNPDHLRPGTQKENMQDMIAKKRDRIVGSRAPRARLTEQDVLRIREQWRSPEEIAEEYNISVTHAAAVRRGDFWKHVQ